MTDAGAWAADRPRARFFYGWVVLGVAALAMVGTLPGRTQGLGLITEPLLRDLGIGRVRFAEINLVATLLGSLFCFGVGRLIDRRGSRVVLTGIALALGATVLAMSRATTVAALVLLITLTRGFGQSALSVVSLAMVGKWFRRRLTRAMAVYALVMSVGFMAAFPLVGSMVLSGGWRAAWAALGLCLAAGLAPLAWLLVRSDPESMGLEVDGSPAPDPAERSPAQATLRDAVRTPAFWVFALASAIYGLVASGIGLFNESILAQRGFAPEVYHRALAVTALTALAGNFAAGAYAGRPSPRSGGARRPSPPLGTALSLSKGRRARGRGGRGSFRRLLVAALVILASALVGLAHVTTTAQVFIQAVAMGIAGGFVMVVFFGFWGRAYGRLHLGRIQGAAQAMTVVASAVGPLLLAWCVDVTGSYAAAFYALAAGVAALAAAAAAVPMPAGSGG